jgi:MFS family permease
MGLIDYIKDPDWFLFFSFLAQGLGGLGGGANLTSSMAILSSFDGAEREVYIGWIEAANGIGLLFGPLIGAFLFSIGGYRAPFFTFAGVYLLFYPCIIASLHSYNRQKREIDERMGKGTSHESEKKEDVRISALVKHPRFLFGLLS